MPLGFKKKKAHLQQLGVVSRLYVNDLLHNGMKFYRQHLKKKTPKKKLGFPRKKKVNFFFSSSAFV